MTTTTHTNNIMVPLLDFCIAILNTNAAEVPPRQEVRAMNAIMALVRDTVTDDKYAVELSKCCFNVCETLKNTIRGKNSGDLDKSKEVVMKDREEVIRRIENIVQRAASTPLPGGEVESHARNTLHALKLPLGEDRSLDERFITLMSEIFGSGFDLRELPSLVVDAILSSDGEGEMIYRFPVDDAQILIDVIDDVLHGPDLSPVTRNQCLELLYRTCGNHALLPTALKIPTCCDQTGDAMYKGGYADVWKGEHRGREVAVKVIRTYSDDELRKIIHRLCKGVVMWRFLQHPNVLPLLGVSVSENRFAIVTEWMSNGNINQFVKAHPEGNRLELLAGVAKGLIYLHNNDVVHGDLKGANILIDETGQARLADFGLLTIVSDPANVLSSSSTAQSDTVRWMSPELIDPELFGLEKSSPTESSDCYALGMVIYETISGTPPFYGSTDFAVSLKVVKGERPRREAEFKGSLWNVLETCWASDPDGRPSIEDVLRCLESPAQGGSLLKQAFGVFSRKIIALLFILVLAAIYY